MKLKYSSSSSSNRSSSGRIMIIIIFKVLSTYDTQGKVLGALHVTFLKFLIILDDIK